MAWQQTRRRHGRFAESIPCNSHIICRFFFLDSLYCFVFVLYFLLVQLLQSLAKKQGNRHRHRNHANDTSDGPGRQCSRLHEGFTGCWRWRRSLISITITNRAGNWISVGPARNVGIFLKDVVKEVACDKIAPWWGGGLYTDVVRMEYRGEGGFRRQTGGTMGG